MSARQIQRSRVGRRSRTVSQSIMTGPLLVIKMLLIFGSTVGDHPARVIGCQ